MKGGSRRWRSTARWLGVATVVALGAAGSRAPLPPASWVTDAQAQTAPETKAESETGRQARRGEDRSPEARQAQASDRQGGRRGPREAHGASGSPSAPRPHEARRPPTRRSSRSPPAWIGSATIPCTKCHDNKFVDRRVRELQDEHTKLVFEHGGGRFWCYDACHKGTDMDSLVSLRGRRVSYDESYKVCGQCHFQRLDWYFGGHGKRQGAWENQREIPKIAEELKVEDRDQIGRWAGERTILNCTECHDAHSPSIKPFEPSPPPKVRSGLRQPSAKPEPEPKIWERLAEPKGKR